MPPPSDHPSLRLRVLPRPFYVAQHRHDEPLSPDLLNLLVTSNKGSFISITRTDEELSIVGEANSTASDKKANWTCIKIAGPMDFGLTGVLSSFTQPLKEASIPVFAVSTWNTDYVLVPKDKAEGAVGALRKDGWIFVEDGSAMKEN